MTARPDLAEIAARLDKLIAAVEALASQLAYWEQWQREQAQWPRQVTVMERTR